MSSTKYIFGSPDTIEGVGRIYPIKLIDYEKFINGSTFLYFSKDHFTEEVREQFSLFELIIISLYNDNIIDHLIHTFSLVTRNEVKLIEKSAEVKLAIGDSQGYIDKNNYDVIRNIIMNQNLMFEQKVYKDRLVAEWMDKVRQAKAKDSIKMEFEDMISTVSVYTGKHYWDLSEYTIYQLYSDFNRIAKLKNYDMGMFARTSGADIKTEHYAENIDLLKNPNDLENFTKNKDNMKMLNNKSMN